MILLTQPPEFEDHRCAPPCPGRSWFLSIMLPLYPHRCQKTTVALLFLSCKFWLKPKVFPFLFFPFTSSPHSLCPLFSFSYPATSFCLPCVPSSSVCVLLILPHISCSNQGVKRGISYVFVTMCNRWKLHGTDRPRGNYYVQNSLKLQTGMC